MSRILSNLFMSFSLLLAPWSLSYASPQKSKDPEAAVQKPLDLEAIDTWQKVRLDSISNDGEWFSYSISPSKDEEEGEAAGKKKPPAEGTEGDGTEEESEKSTGKEDKKAKGKKAKDKKAKGKKTKGKKAKAEKAKAEKNRKEAEQDGEEEEAEKPHRLIVESTSDGKMRFPFDSESKMDGGRFSEDSKWFAFLRSPEGKDKAVKKAKKAGPPKRSAGSAGGPHGKDSKKELVLLELTSGETKTFANVVNFALLTDAVVLKKGEDQAHLLLYMLADGSFRHLGPVAEYAANKSGDHLAWTVSAEDFDGNGAFLRDNRSAEVSSLDTDATLYQNLSWADEGDALVVVKGKPEDDDEFETLYDVVAFSGIGTPSGLRTSILSPKSEGFPEGMVIDISDAGSGRGGFRRSFGGGNPTWLEDRSGLRLNLRQREKNDDEEDEKKQGAMGQPGGGSAPGKKPGKKDSKTPDLALWHWNIEDLPSQEPNGGKVEDRHDLMPTLYWLEQERWVPLLSEDDFETSESFLLPRLKDARQDHPFVLAIDRGDTLAAILDSTQASNRKADVYLVDVAKGERTQILTQVDRATGALSPDGQHFAFYDQEHFHLYDIEARSHINLTEKLPTSFVDSDDSNPERVSRANPIWTEDGHLLLRDNWDIWLVPMTAGEPAAAVNLTVDGASAQIDYSIMKTSSPRDMAEQKSNPFAGFFDPLEIDLSTDPLYIHAVEKRTKRTGYGAIRARQAGIHWLRPLEDAHYNAPSPFDMPVVLTDDGRNFFYYRSTFREKVYFKADREFEDRRELLVDGVGSLPTREGYLWSAGTRLIDYECTWGDEVEGVIFLPADYQEGQRYPTITLIYEDEMSSGLHRYGAPGLSSYDWRTFTSLGYAVFMADIRFQFEDPGLSGFQCLMPGLDAAIETGVVDPDRIGLHGHSWGGYQSAFYITQTDRFKAVISGAPLTDLISMYGSVYWNSMVPNQMLIERGQGRMLKHIWDGWEHYRDNSPLYHAQKVATPLLLLHNDKDGAVPFFQGMTYFNALRRLKKEVVMLQYRGQNHGVRGRANEIDYRGRQLEFWAHYLLDEPAPEWWSEGIEPDEMKEHLEERGIEELIPSPAEPESEDEETSDSERSEGTN